MFLFNKSYIESSANAKGQWDYVKGLRESFASQQRNHVSNMTANGVDNSAISANTGIGMLDFFQDVDKRLVSIRQNTKFAIVKDIESLATSVPISALSGINLMAGDVSDDVTRSMDLQGKVSFDNLSSNYDKNPIPAFTAGVGMNFRTYMGQESAQLGLYAEAIQRKSVKLMENIGDYMYNGDVKVSADGQKAKALKVIATLLRST